MKEIAGNHLAEPQVLGERERLPRVAGLKSEERKQGHRGDGHCDNAQGNGRGGDHKSLPGGELHPTDNESCEAQTGGVDERENEARESNLGAAADEDDPEEEASNRKRAPRAACVPSVDAQHDEWK